MTFFVFAIYHDFLSQTAGGGSKPADIISNERGNSVGKKLLTLIWKKPHTRLCSRQYCAHRFHYNGKMFLTLSASCKLFFFSGKCGDTFFLKTLNAC